MQPNNIPPGGGDGRPYLKLFQPDAESDYDPAMAPTSPTLWRAIHARIESMSLRVQSGTASLDAFTNTTKYLTRFGNAWSVRLVDGRHFLIPAFEPKRRDKLKFSAASEQEAIEQAANIAASLTGISPPTLGATVCRNGDRLLSDCTNDDLTRWMVVNPQWESGHTKTNNLIAIVDCVHWFEDEHGFKAPYRRKKIPKMVKASRREATDIEYITLMRNGCRELRRVLWCHYNLVGIRPNEVRGMLWPDFNWEGAFVLTYQHKKARETNKPRVFCLTARQLRFFRALHRQRPAETDRLCGKCRSAAPHRETDHVFLNTDGIPWSRRTLGQNLRRTAERCGLDGDAVKRVSLGCFRQTFATQSDEAGALDQDTAMLMGHADTKMLKTVYSKASKKVKHVRGAARRAERLRREARKRKPGEDEGE